MADERHAPLIGRYEPDWLLRTLALVVVALLGFICVASYNGNREMGEMRSEFRVYREYMEGRVSNLEREVWGRK